MAMARPTLPVTLHLGDLTAADLGTVTIPFTTKDAGKTTAGQWHVEVLVDQKALRQSLAAVLRDAADRLEKGAPDGD